MHKSFANQEKVAGIVKVTENIYKVDVNLLQVEDGISASQDELLKFFNPRCVGMGTDVEIVGFNDEQMENLRRSIQSQGLMNPLVGRYKDGKVSLIEGHRRYAAIAQLIDEDVSCYDPASGTQIPASCLYGFVLMRVYDSSISEEECYALSFQEDKSKEKFGSGAEIRFVYFCMMRDISDARIIEMLGNTPEWLKETKAIIRAFENDDIILQAIFTDGVNRSAAKSLAQIEDLSERREIFDCAIAEAKEDANAKIEKLRRQISAISNKIEIAKTKRVIAEATSKVEEIDKYDAEILGLIGRKEDVEKEITESAPVVNPESLRKGADKRAKVSTGRPKSVPSRLGASERISTKWRKFLENLNEKPQIGDDDINSDMIEMCLDLLNSCTDKENSPEEFILKWNAKL
jgi:hypothetical protein